MKKKTYQTPSLKTITLRQQVFLLAESGVEANRTNYGKAVTYEWD